MSTEIIDKIKAKFGDKVKDSHNFRGDQTVVVDKACVYEVAQYLRDEPSLDMNFLMDLTAVDYLDKKKVRFEVVYHFFSLKHNHRFRVKAPVDEEECILDSVVPLYHSANWYEREVWDMYGIKFKGHPNLKRILMYEGFKGHPLRKDYPINKRQPLIGPLN
ncbi:NADH-quinone oxidoreductase, subunit C [Nitrospina gracilis 3/211]|uniref:NADH-quinone oxidoreductase subunit C n=1 Tax=Nitrospina gracilis (strain 3/211) TaxID=1266370 RepID=M1YL46_NITG3|nr:MULTISPECIES: NADH-quinone oxidoreductase subunit C [Nitrospina]MCF8724041.1 NADH-quinone oxidoreductase subunit C [Nitrospina sp. Nb-3]CCQ91171.1 NADH-quinone oxidoreductase, subunit C [Nitrospina gracilis 3/211]